jgi:hypothetical protein
MQALRNASFLARLVLAWFALSIGIAVASPLVKPAGMQLICSGGGIMQVLATSDDGGQLPASPTLDCPLCAGLGAPPPFAYTPAEPLLPLAQAVQSIPSARIAALTAAPLPARGPPLPLTI